MNKHHYFERSLDWAGTQAMRDQRSRQVAWIIAGIAAASAALLAVALIMLMPLKRVEPVMLLVDRQTGHVERVDPNSARTLTADEALTQSLLAQYVTGREQFDRATAQADYRRVGLWSAGSARSSYLGSMPASNPSSPFNVYKPGSVVQVRVKSVSKVSPGLSLVRFGSRLIDETGRAGTEMPMIATVRFRFVDGTMSFDDRLINPLGFQVTSYRRDAEAAELTAPPTAQIPAGAAL